MNKCAKCKNGCYEGASLDYPYPHAWCSKKHWEGIGESDNDIDDPWADCEDFECSGIKINAASANADFKIVEVIDGKEYVPRCVAKIIIDNYEKEIKEFKEEIECLKMVKDHCTACGTTEFLCGCNQR